MLLHISAANTNSEP